MKDYKSNERGRFTLIELLMVVAMILILTGLLLPAVGKALRRAEIISCTSNLKNIALSIFSYGNDHNGWFPFEPAITATNDYDNMYKVVLHSFKLLCPTYLPNPEIFVCPGAMQEKPASVSDAVWTKMNVAYAYQPGLKTGPNKYFAYNATYTYNPADASKYVLIMDQICNKYYKNFGIMLPYYGTGMTLIGEGNQPTLLNHGIRGANITYADGHVNFSASRYSSGATFVVPLYGTSTTGYYNRAIFNAYDW